MSKKQEPVGSHDGQDPIFMSDNGHPTGEAILLYYEVISPEEAGFTFTPELREAFARHVQECNFCQWWLDAVNRGVALAETNKLIKRQYQA